MSPIPLTQILIRLLVALACGAVLGLEREAQHKPAGFRTNILIALGATAYTLVTLGLFAGVAGQSEAARADVLRLVQGIVGGIGFLGAGTIIQSSGSIKGMTTAATIWVLGAIGIACGAGQFHIAIATVGFAMLVLTAFGFIERRTTKRDSTIDGKRRR
jgi:putative Mg2+ transporter-C (MgtC) family protein